VENGRFRATRSHHRGRRVTRGGRESAPFSLTLQGAASLGTYEAAVNWTVIA